MTSHRILITGAAGFIGSSIARELAKQGIHTRGMDNLSTGSLANLSGLEDYVEFTEADLLDERSLLRLCDGVDVVFHEAAIPSVPKSVRDPLTSHRSNVDGTLNLLLAARRCGVKRVVYAASSSAYGDVTGSAKQETMRAAPISPYAVQKLCGEHYMQSFHAVYGLETICLRYFNVFGPHQAANSPYSGVLAKFITEMLAGRSPSIFGDGTQSRDFTFIDNVVEANLLAGRAPANAVSGKVYNVACGNSASLLDVYAMLQRITGFQGAPRFLEARVGDVRDSLADIRAAAQDLGYRPSVKLFDGLERTVEWYRQQISAEILVPQVIPGVAIHA
ncbi:SDR family oxidoreductase [Terriglobus roseus]|uniref:UDP-glucose 4-epimerase n=1 Tax=Terriglobus roseus TaxID=392734 RepID=A0A1H4SJ99_9BACT|nr:SDR family oxidoreductase [Terriglobus roseus]SEC43931.1 UDP-glucose 4-epimerase [Terriglobus roseus]